MAKARRLQVLLAVMWGALAFQGLAVAQQLQWHAHHPGTPDAAALFVAHSGIHAGILLTAALSAIARAQARRTTAGRGATRALTAALVGALAQGAAMAWDSFAHAGGADAAAAHEAYKVATALLVLGLGAATFALGRAARPAPAAAP